MKLQKISERIQEVSKPSKRDWEDNACKMKKNHNSKEEDLEEED